MDQVHGVLYEPKTGVIAQLLVADSEDEILNYFHPTMKVILVNLPETGLLPQHKVVNGKLTVSLPAAQPKEPKAE